MNAASRANSAVQDRATLQRYCREAIEALDRALSLPGNKVGEPVDEGERAAVRLRDGLIDLLRAESGSDDGAASRSALKQVNAALSVIVGVEYPVGGVQRKRVQLARDTLQSVLDGDLAQRDS